MCANARSLIKTSAIEKLTLCFMFLYFPPHPSETLNNSCCINKEVPYRSLGDKPIPTISVNIPPGPG